MNFHPVKTAFGHRFKAPGDAAGRLMPALLRAWAAGGAALLLMLMFAAEPAHAETPAAETRYTRVPAGAMRRDR